MASALRRKRSRGVLTKRVADMTAAELQDLIESAVDRKMAEWASNPRIARRRSEIAANAAATHREYQTGKVHRGTVQDLLATMR